MKFEIKNRWSGAVQFTAEIECDESASVGVKMGLAVRWGLRARAVLRDADLTGAVLRGADLRDADLTGADLTEADLRGADLTGAVLTRAVLRGADLTRAVLRGADLRDAVLRGADLTRAVLRGADLTRAVLRGAVLRGADLRDADLTGADLRDADLTDAVLTDAILRDAILRDAVLTGAVLTGVPVIPNIHQAVLAAATPPGALDMTNWHTCDTTHCRAGWVVALAGDDGKKLQSNLGNNTELAAAMIYIASDPAMQKVPDFYCSNERALGDMRAAAAAEIERIKGSP